MTENSGRWSRATIYEDMWVDPDDDPRDTGASPDGELATLRDVLDGYRLTLTMKCDGLDAEQLARRSVPPSPMSLLGLVRHLAEVERDWRGWFQTAEPRLYGAKDADFEAVVGDPAMVEEAFADLVREQETTDAALLAFADLGERFGEDRTSVRELWVHRVEEYARHCGHADLLRECVDGRVGQ